MSRYALFLLHEYRVNLPEGKSGGWSVEKYSYTAEDLVDKARKYPYDRRYAPFIGVTYTRLTVDPPLVLGLNTEPMSVVMSDEPYEVAGLLEFTKSAHGHVVMTGLGLGLGLSMMEPNDSISKVTVVENSPDVLKLTGGYWKDRYGDRLEIVEADAHTWHPETVFDCAFHDLTLTDRKVLSKLYKVTDFTMYFEHDAWNSI